MMNRKVKFRIIVSAPQALEELEKSLSDHTILHRAFPLGDNRTRWKWSGEFAAEVNEDGLIAANEIFSAIELVSSLLRDRDDILRQGVALDLKAGDLLAFNLNAGNLSHLGESGFEFGFEIFESA